MNMNKILTYLYSCFWHCFSIFIVKYYAKVYLMCYHVSRVACTRSFNESHKFIFAIVMNYKPKYVNYIKKLWLKSRTHFINLKYVLKSLRISLQDLLWNRTNGTPKWWRSRSTFRKRRWIYRQVIMTLAKWWW